MNPMRKFALLRHLQRRSPPWRRSGAALAEEAFEMPVSALVLTTDKNFGEIPRMKLESDPRITLGEPRGAFLPVVTDTSDITEARDLVDLLLSVEGIADAQLVSWADEDAVSENLDEETNHGA